MKARILILGLVLLAACQPMDTDFDYQNTRTGTSDADSVFTLTLQAIKTVDTKALDLIGDARLNQYWKNTDKVKVFHNGTCVGTLNVSCQGDRPTTATLTGSVQIHGLAENDVLTLLIPREIFDYTGQKGRLTKASDNDKGTIEDTYDYGMATVTVGTISGTTVTTTADARFENQQSIYRFGFGTSGSLAAREFTVLSANGKLVQSVSYEGGAWTPAFGPITVKPTVPNPIPASNFYYVALRNGSTDEDTYSFVIVDSNHKLHLATKQIPGTALAVPGKFISAKNIDAPAATFTPSEDTEVNVVY